MILGPILAKMVLQSGQNYDSYCGTFIKSLRKVFGSNKSLYGEYMLIFQRNGTGVPFRAQAVGRAQCVKHICFPTKANSVIYSGGPCISRGQTEENGLLLGKLS